MVQGKNSGRGRATSSRRYRIQARHPIGPTNLTEDNAKKSSAFQVIRSSECPTVSVGVDSDTSEPITKSIDAACRCERMAQHAYDLVTALDLSAPDTWDYQLFRKRFETSPLGSCIVDESGNILDVNVALLNATHKTNKSEFVAAGFASLHSPDELARLEAFRAKVFESGWAILLVTPNFPGGEKKTIVFGIRVVIWGSAVCVSWGDSAAVEAPRAFDIHRRPPEQLMPGKRSGTM